MGSGRKQDDEPIDLRMQISNSLVCCIASDFFLTVNSLGRMQTKYKYQWPLSLLRKKPAF